MGCSALNSDLIRKNIVNSPRCTCDAIETPTHYLLNVPRYNIPRQRHIFALNLPIPLFTELLLVGSNELTINLNTEIFLSVQKFILSSKRFTNPFHFPAQFIPYGVKYNYHFTDPYNVFYILRLLKVDLNKLGIRIYISLITCFRILLIHS
jgi:hypothetical protein